MTNEYKTFLTDEILHFLYRNAAFQALEEGQQQLFLKKFDRHPLFKEVAEIAIALEEMIAEVEATMPKIQDKDFLFPIDQQKRLLKEQTVTHGNVLYVPFEGLVKSQSPMIVIVQQSDSMRPFDAFSKGTVLPLFNLCAMQKRDFIIISFSGETASPLLFEQGTLQLAPFVQFMEHHLTGEARIVPAIEKALALFEQDSLNHQRDLMIITDNQFIDFRTLTDKDFTAQIRELAIDISVIAMSEADFEMQPIPFADKVFFANE